MGSSKVAAAVMMVVESWGRSITSPPPKYRMKRLVGDGYEDSFALTIHTTGRSSGKYIDWRKARANQACLKRHETPQSSRSAWETKQGAAVGGDIDDKQASKQAGKQTQCRWQRYWKVVQIVDKQRGSGHSLFANHRLEPLTKTFQITVSYHHTKRCSCAASARCRIRRTDL